MSYSCPPILTVAVLSSISPTLLLPFAACARRLIRIGRLIDLIVPARDNRGRHAGVPLGDLSLPGVLALAVYLVAAHDCSLDSRRGEFNALALGGQVGGRDAELHLVQPEIAVLAVCFLCTKTNGDRCAAVLTGGDDNAVLVDYRSCQVRRSGCADIVHAKG